MAAGSAPRRAPRLGRAIWTIALPLLFAEVGETLIQFTDTALLGRVGVAELAAIGPVDAILDAALVPAVGLVEGMQILVARRSGEGREGGAVAGFGRVLLTVGVVALLVAALIRIGSGAFGDELFSSRQVAGAVDDFFRFGAWGIVFLSLNLAYSSLWVGLGRTRVLVAATAVLVAANLALSLVLIFGGLGLPALGIEGAGIGFLGAELAAFLVLSVHTVRQLGLDAARVVRPGGDGAISLSRVGRLGAPIGLQALVEALRWVGFFLIVERMGEEALGWSSLVYACYALLQIPAQAFAETAYTTISGSLGSGESDGIGRVMRAVTWRTYAVTLPLVAAAVLLPGTVLSVFTDDPQAVAGASGPLRAVALGMVVVVGFDLWLGAVFGTGDADAGFGIELLVSTLVVAGAAVAAILFDAGLPVVWLALALGSGVGLAISFGWIRSGRWRRVAV